MRGAEDELELLLEEELELLELLELLPELLLEELELLELLELPVDLVACACFAAAVSCAAFFLSSSSF